jgi:hypothetical protein
MTVQPVPISLDTLAVCATNTFGIS